MKDVKKRLEEHRQELQRHLNTIDLIDGMAIDILDKIDELWRKMNLLGKDTNLVIFDNYNCMNSNLNHILRYLTQRYDITSNEIKALDQILSDDTKEEINPDHVEEFEKLLSDGDVPF